MYTDSVYVIQYINNCFCEVLEIENRALLMWGTFSNSNLPPQLRATTLKVKLNLKTQNLLGQFSIKQN